MSRIGPAGQGLESPVGGSKDPAYIRGHPTLGERAAGRWTSICPARRDACGQQGGPSSPVNFGNGFAPEGALSSG
jgi:hypothetical protein